MAENAFSPVPAPATPIGMDFPSAMRKVIDGEKITRLEWQDQDDKIYGVLQNSFLMLRKEDGYHQWIVTDGDMIAIDWIVVPNK